MDWYRVIKKIKGRGYVYLQRTWREGKRVRTENRYLGPVDWRSGNDSTTEHDRVAYHGSRKGLRQGSRHRP